MSRVLVVDDERSVLRVMTLLLRIAGLEPEAFDRPQDAFQAFARDPHGYALLVTDVMMPGMSGTELASQVLVARPDLPIIFVSGFAPGPDVPKGELLTRFPLLTKPDQVPLLKVTATTALRRRPESQE